MPTLTRLRALVIGVLCAATLLTASPADAVNPRDRDEVAAAYRAHYAAYAGVTSGWSGSTLLCLPGLTSPAAQTGTAEAINFARSLNGLDPVTISPLLSLRAQLAALVMAANGVLSHTPDAGWKCWSPPAAKAAAGSLLAQSTDEMTVGEAVGQYLGDPGDSNTAAGHRRWLLDPRAGRLGNALTTSTSAIYVVGSADAGRRSPDWTSWPSAGWFPAPLEPAGRWSLSSGSPQADFSRAVVEVTDSTGRALPVTVHPPEGGLGLPTLVFEVGAVSPSGTYRVVVRRIAGAAARKVSYRVRLFAP